MDKTARHLVAALEACPSGRVRLERVLDSPDDDSARREFAQALGPQARAWADLIAASLDWALIPDEHKDQRRDLLRIQVEGLESVPLMDQAVRSSQGGFRVGLRRGFVEHLVASAQTLLGGLTRAVQLAPITSLEIREVDDDSAASLAASPALERMQELEIASRDIGDRGARALLSSPHLGQLERIWFGDSSCTDATLELLTRLPAVRSLRISGMGGTRVSAQALTRWVRAVGPVELGVDGSALDDSVLKALATSPAATRLTALAARASRATPEGLDHLAELVGLQTLHLSSARPMDERLPIWLPGGLRRLTLYGVSAATLRALSGAACVSLDRLSIRSGAADAGALESLGQFPGLVWLGASDMELSDEDAKTLGSAPYAPLLTRLDVSDNAIGPTGLTTILDSMPSLVMLNLSGNPIGDAGAMRIAANPPPGLERLELVGCRVGAQAARALLAAPALRRCHLNVGPLDSALSAEESRGPRPHRILLSSLPHYVG